MKTIPTKNGELLCVEVPMDAIEMQLSPLGEPLLIGKLAGNKFTDFVVLSYVKDSDKYTIMGTITNGVLDFDAEPYVRRIDYEGSKMYQDYKFSSTDTYTCLFAKDSFLSLLTSHNVEYSGKKIVILQTK